MREALAAVQRWIADDRAGRLVLVTRDTDLPGAAVGGLLRSAQAEHPGRFGHVTLDGHPDSERALPAAAALADEPWVAVRAGETYVPRLARTGAQRRDDGAPFGPDDVVLGDRRHGRPRQAGGPAPGHRTRCAAAGAGEP